VAQELHGAVVTAPVYPVLDSLPEVFVEATTEGNVRAARDLLKEGIGLVRRGDDIDGLRALGNAHQLLDRLVKLFERPKNDETGREVCPVCSSRTIMPNGRCLDHGGEWHMADRNLTEVIDAMLPLVPTDQAEMKKALERHRHSSVFQAPELMHMVWEELGLSLHENLGAVPPDWSLPMLRVFLGSEWPRLCRQLGIDPERGENRN
jgi:hypothetical protein